MGTVISVLPAPEEPGMLELMNKWQDASLKVREVESAIRSYESALRNNRSRLETLKAEEEKVWQQIASLRAKEASAK